MVTTSPDNIFSPDSGAPYALTTDLAVMADSVQDALISRANRIGTSAARTAATAASPTGTLWWDTTIGVLTIKGVSTWTAVSPLVQYGDTGGLTPTLVRKQASVSFPRAYASAPGFIVSSYITPNGSTAWANASVNLTTASTGTFYYNSSFDWSSSTATFSWVAIGVPAL